MEAYDNFSLTTSTDILNISKLLINSSFWNFTGNTQMTELNESTPSDKWTEIGRMIEIIITPILIVYGTIGIKHL